MHMCIHPRCLGRCPLNDYQVIERPGRKKNGWPTKRPRFRAEKMRLGRSQLAPFGAWALPSFYWAPWYPTE